MADGILIRIPLPVMTVVIAVLALGVEVLGLIAGLGARSLLLLFIPGALAVAFLMEYRKLPYVPWGTRTESPPASDLPEEEFIDPVEEADRIAQEPPSAEPSAALPPDAPAEGPGPGAP